MTRSAVSTDFPPSRLSTLLALGTMMALLGAPPAWSQPVDPPRTLGSLKSVPTPEPANLNQYLRTDENGVIAPRARAAALALGKALFWDQAVGSDGQACASCHFNAGADSRTRNQVNPGQRAIPSQNVWGARPPQQTSGTGAIFAPDHQLRMSDFPLLKFNIPGDRNSGVASDTQAVVSSAGVFNTMFVDVAPLQPCPPVDQAHLGVSICDHTTQDLSGNGVVFNRSTPATATGQVRNVEPRNTPTVINAVFNFRNFWDGRARNEFNGVNPIGDLDPYARVLLNGVPGGLRKVSLTGNLRLENASLASQAVGPTLSDMEMSAQQRSFAKLGKKMLALPNGLTAQLVSPADSVLGNTRVVKSNYPAKGIDKSYAELIRLAFQPQWYNSQRVITFAGAKDADGTDKLQFSAPPPGGTRSTDQFTQMEFNFSLFWGIAIQMYEATLRADDSPMDQAFDSGDPMAFTAPSWGDKEKLGLTLFLGAGKCVGCHSGPETTNAAVQNIQEAGTVESMDMADGRNAQYDDGYYNIAVRRCLDQKAGPAACDDVGVGATIGPLDLPLSMSRFAQRVASHDPTNPNDPITIVCANQPAACNVQPVAPTARVAVDGAFKA
ncbi:MAG TPA: cytochrome c peroxidase, partial [Burkholderiales bacterium]